MTTECPHCKALNESYLPEETIETTIFEGIPYLVYYQILRCFYCKKHYIWCEGLNHKWRGIPAPGFVDVI